MIDFRYHIVSLVAVFLALGLGILLGSSVVSGPLEAKLHDDLKTQYDKARAAARDAADATASFQSLRKLLEEQSGPWAVRGRLSGRPVVLIVDDIKAPGWRDHLTAVLQAAGAVPSGTILLGDKWALKQTTDLPQLLEVMRGVDPVFEAGNDPVSAALTLLGKHIFDAEGHALVDGLVTAGFLSVEQRPSGDWPADGSAAVVLSPARSKLATPPWGAPLARGIADVGPTLVVSDSSADVSAVANLRNESGLQNTLATFDAATADVDPGGLGVTAALIAAIDSEGGHYGTERGRSFVLAPSPGP